MTLWAAGFLAGTVVVLIVAVLLVGILHQAQRIRRLAHNASTVVAEIDENTRSVWSLTATNNVARELLEGAGAIDENAAAIVGAVGGESRNDSVA